MNLKAGPKSMSSQSQNSNTNVHSWCESIVPSILGSGPYLGDILFANCVQQGTGDVAVLGVPHAKSDAGISLDPIGIHYMAY